MSVDLGFGLKTRPVGRREPSEAELAEMTPDQLAEYADTFDGEPEPMEPPPPRRLDASISIRFSTDELERLRTDAEAVGMKVTAYIRTVVLQRQAAEVVDLVAVRAQLATLSRDVHELQHRLG